MKMILDYLLEFGTGTRTEIEQLLIAKLPEVLNIEQKKNKVKNLLQKLKRDDKIVLGSQKKWSLK